MVARIALGVVENPRDRVPALDGLRGLAILAVFLFHYVGEGGTQPHSFLLRAIYGITRFGWASVDLFFALSGFLITEGLRDSCVPDPVDGASEIPQFFAIGSTKSAPC